MQKSKHPSSNRSVFKICLVYFILGTLWITFTDHAVFRLFDDSQAGVVLQTTKGLLYIFITSIVLYFFIQKYFRQNETIYNEWVEEKKRHIETLKNNEKKLNHLVSHDFLTNLPNRYRLNQDLEKVINKEDVNIALIILDIDRFKTINDTFGHHFGDELLHQLAKRLHASVHTYPVKVYRLGGDEFTIVITSYQNIEHLCLILDGIRREISLPYDIHHQKIEVSFSMGVSIYQEDAHDITALFKHADIAMYTAKDSGGNNYKFYLEESKLKVDSFRLEHELKDSIKRNELKLYYQPRYDFHNERIDGVEALVRWHHPERGLISPADFIPIAEEMGYISKLGHWVIEQSFKQLQIWHQEGMKLSVAINLSAKQLSQKFFLEDILELMKKYRIDPVYVEFEVTETMVMYNLETSIQFLKRLKGLGFKVALDDFGTGYSSLNYLKIIPTDYMKIDRTFIKEIPKNKVDTSIVKSLLQLGKDLKIHVIAEGVEDSETISFLREHDCGGMQGYFLSKPVEAEKIQEIVKDSHTLPL
ncbi:bifunctional diguanylate cyclase/phosphodiesterase [Bacillus shivajii]|uniref:putative bifunctional diguanylate cyclase/phosphodiesterase n=1 Tax=Bacillus shivajii TaxID=1983719 RepID=UPI001CF9B215|nr:bifunctional diguanylate cyclase/phosphodiesterase [Bacillus shivajii]UCZ54087.1 bifunctional diguanylate cyclase/phosphodiesterase [Bacillus shivajii]